MIFVTVGTQGPFDRMIAAVDLWAEHQGRADVFAQIGAGTPPEHIEWVRDLTPGAFEARLEAADAVVAHAGMGTILTALSLGKPVVVMPRKASLGEHRNEHQTATTERFEAMGRVTAVWDAAAMGAALDGLASAETGERLAAQASPELLKRLRGFLEA